MAKKNLSDLIEAQASTLTSPSTSISSNSKPSILALEAGMALQQRIQELETEVFELRKTATSQQDKGLLEQQIQELTEKLVQIGGEHEIKIELLDPDPAQPRTIFPRQLIEERAESLQRNNQISPIIVIPQANGRYRIFDGAIRKLAAPHAGLTTLRAVFLPHNNSLDNASRFEKQFVTGKDTEKLHYLDLANGLIQIICNRYPYLKSQQSDIPNILNNALYQIKKTGKLAELNKIRNSSTLQQQEWLETVGFESPEARNIFEVILDRQFNPTSVASNIFPILAIPDDLKTIVQETGLEPSKVKAIAKLTADTLKVDEEIAKNIRSEIADKIVEEEKSLEETNEVVRKIVKQYNPTAPQENIKAEKTIKQLQSFKFDGLEVKHLKDIRSTLRQKLKELDTLIKGS